MKIKVLNKGEINIDNSYLKNEFEGRNSNTSYINEFKIKDDKIKCNSDFYFRLICYKNILEKIKGTYSSNLDLFGGVGITAKLFSGENVNTYVNDIDENCLNILMDNFENVLSFDSFKFDIKSKFDLILSDYNDFTVSKFIKDRGYFESLEKILQHSNKYVIINDCSVFYLKYGEKSFKVYSDLLNSKINCFEDLILSEKKLFEESFPGWKVVNIEYFHNSSFFLFQKTESEEFNMNRVFENKEQIIECEL